MELWRLSDADHAERFDGGYGLVCEGRWNGRGRPVTYCSTGPALCVLEKLVHIDDPALLPDEMMLVRYDAPDDMAVGDVPVDGLPELWRTNRAVTMGIGNGWLDGISTCLLHVPSVVVPVRDTRDRNVIINHRHAAASRITISRIETFRYDPRLFAFG
ncbi:MAG: RES family NAD+ phosphorylase [Acidobacteria bacterium]|nr:RES family NAD+ phosphorylase [Acidobacteriota bacterium]